MKEILYLSENALLGSTKVALRRQDGTWSFGDLLGISASKGLGGKPLQVLSL